MFSCQGPEVSSEHNLTIALISRNDNVTKLVVHEVMLSILFPVVTCIICTILTVGFSNLVYIFSWRNIFKAAFTFPCS